MGFVRQPAAEMVCVVMPDALASALQSSQLPAQPASADRAFHLARLQVLFASDLGVQHGSVRHGIDSALTVGGLSHVTVQSYRAGTGACGDERVARLPRAVSHKLFQVWRLLLRLLLARELGTALHRCD